MAFRKQECTSLNSGLSVSVEQTCLFLPTNTSWRLAEDWSIRSTIYLALTEPSAGPLLAVRAGVYLISGRERRAA